MNTELYESTIITNKTKFTKVFIIFLVLFSKKKQ